MGRTRRTQKDNRPIIATVICKSTGNEMGVMRDGDKIVKRSQSEYLDANHLHFNVKTRYVRVFDYIIDPLTEVLSASGIALLFKLTKFVSYNDGILRMGGHGNGRILNLKDLSDILNTNKKTMTTRISELVHNDILRTYQCEYATEKYTHCYVMNPYICIRGTVLNKQIKNLFDDSQWKQVYDESKCRGDHIEEEV